MEGEGGEEATDSLEPQTSHKQSFFFLAWLVTFTELEKVLKCCLSFRHCRDCFNVLQNHTFRQYFLPMCLLVVAVILGTETRLKQDNLLALMSTVGPQHSLHLHCYLNTAHPGTTCNKREETTFQLKKSIFKGTLKKKQIMAIIFSFFSMFASFFSHHLAQKNP